MKIQWFSIFLPVPDRALWGNSHCHPLKYHRIFKKAKQNAQVIALGQGRFSETYTRGDVYITWLTRTKRRPDGDNALIGLKPYFDAFQAIKLIDDDKNFRYFPIDFKVKRSGALGVEIKILLERD